MAVARIRTGVILVLIGGLLLLNTTGLLDVEVWESILVLWPLLLIAIGIEKIFTSTRTLKPLAYLSPLIIVATVAYAVIAIPERNLFSNDSVDRRSFEWSVPANQTISRLDLGMDFGGGRLKVRGGAERGQLLEGQFYTRGRKPAMEADGRGDVMEVSLSRKSGGVALSRRSRERWILKLSETVPVDLSLEAGGAQVRLDLADVVIQKLDLETGAADIDLILGAKSPQVECIISCGAASIDMVIPAGAGLRVKRKSALSSFSTGDIELTKRGSYLETLDFESNPVRVLLRIDSGVSSMRIRQSDDIGVGGSI
jgi:hypothetical protein